MANGFNPQIAPTVLGSGTEPLQFLQRSRALDQRKEAQQQALAQRQQTNRDTAIGKLMQFQPDKAWEPYDKVIKNQANQLRQWTVQQFQEGRNPHDPRFLAELQARKDIVNTTASGSQHLKNLHTQQFKLIHDDPYLKKSYYENKLNNLVYGDDGQSGKALGEIDFGAIQTVTDDARGYDMDKIGRDFVDALPETLSKYYGERENSLGGKFYNITEIKGKAIRDTKINPKTGTYDINITDEVLIQAKEHAYLGKALEQFKEETGITDDKQALGKMLDAFVPQPTRSDTLGRKIAEPGDGSKAEATIVKRAESRYQGIRDVVYNATPDALAGVIDPIQGINAEYYGDKFLPGETRPEGIRVTIQQKGDDPATLKPRAPRVIDLPITTEDERVKAMQVINQLIDETQRSTTKQTVGFDRFMEQHKLFTESGAGGNAAGIYERASSVNETGNIY